VKLRALSILILGSLLVATTLLVLAAQRTDAQGNIDLTGSWEIALKGEVLDGSCELGILQRENAVLLAGGCSLIRPVVLTGTINRMTGEFSASQFGITSDGHASKDGSSMSGTWGGLGFSGTFTGTRIARGVDFIDSTGDWELELGPAQTPLGEFSDVCTAVILQSVYRLFAHLHCERLGEHILDGGIDPVSGDFFALNREDGELEQLYGSVDSAGTLSGTFIINANEDVRGPITGTRTGGHLGDVDCDEMADSIDASLILQWNAGLLTALPCPDFADITGDQMANSLDSILLLQFSAALILNLALHF
jgi:hypothetical protein